ncbi:hypothetical protein N7474_009532 [Penicillium riverlandense]|uniref:uncharacterized protein n=1 Tax=Penicillium riverlandense TaxID=1903569 RepID=UPI002546D5FF|nr:uncharacterized protein N7474_009532 [Penicillium riverlandense]KAJ5808263.1 hypothetical protein N7474_009532 [Penicillium riverlandense]
MAGHISSDLSRSASQSSQTPRPSQGQTGESMSRQSFGRSSRSNPNVFSDEYSLEPLDPDRIERAPSPSGSIASSTTLRSSNHPQKSVSVATTENENPFGDEARVSFDEPHRSSLPQKGAMGMPNHSNSNSGDTTPTGVQRNHSISSRFSIPRALSPYTGATGPSHPYAMYPQVGVSRTASMTSTSTIRQNDRPLGEPIGPQHPYAMYPQNVVEEGMDDSLIPVGFPGHNQHYQPPATRRDDDVGDIIGADGHTEPLPPYSRYPTGAIPKPPGTENLSDSTLQPEEHQLDTVSREAPISNASSRGGIVSEQTPNGDGDGAQRAPLTGIMAFEEKLKRKGKQTACCGLPVWTLVLIGTVMVIGGCIGGAIGGVIGTKRAADAQASAAAQTSGPRVVTVTTPPQIDATSLTATPTNLLPLPTSGSYVIPSNPQNHSKLCVEDQQLKDAWGCMRDDTDTEIYFGGPDGHHSVIFGNQPPSSTFTYGAQPPYLPQPTQPLRMMIDTREINMGPALFFSTLFNKLVIVPEDEFSSTPMKRDFGGGYPDFSKKYTQFSEVGQKPWFCWWNKTMMEFFIYVNQTTLNTQGTGTASYDSEMPAATATSYQESKRDFGHLESYPRRIKIDERRDSPDAVQPYCQQMEVMSNGQITPLSGEYFNVHEIEPTPTTTYINPQGTSQTYTAQAQYGTPCYCVSLTD